MKKLLIVLVLLAAPVYGSSMQDLLKELREGTGEIDSTNSSFTDSAGIDWLNRSEQAIARLTLSYHRETTYAYVSTNNVFSIPATRGVRAIFAKVGNRWYDITGQPEALSFSVTRVDTATSRVYVQVGGFVPRRTYLIFGEDSTAYALPNDFGRVEGVSIWTSNSEWNAIIENPEFMVDTNVSTFYVSWAHPDSAFLYLKTQDIYDGDTIKVDYWAGPVSGDSIRISYYAQIPLMSSGADSICTLDDDLEGFVVKEAMGYYLKSVRDYQGAAEIWQEVRQDLGVGRE